MIVYRMTIKEQVEMPKVQMNMLRVGAFRLLGIPKFDYIKVDEKTEDILFCANKPVLKSTGLLKRCLHGLH